MGQPDQRLFTVTKKNGELGMGEKIVFFLYWLQCSYSSESYKRGLQTACRGCSTLQTRLPTMVKGQALRII